MRIKKNMVKWLKTLDLSLELQYNTGIKQLRMNKLFSHKPAPHLPPYQNYYPAAIFLRVLFTHMMPIMALPIMPPQIPIQI